jgi:hypothetical protein
MTIRDRLGLGTIRSSASQRRLISMAAQFVGLAATPGAASGTLVITVTNSLDGNPVNRLPVAVYQNGAKVDEVITVEMGTAKYNFILNQEGTYTFTAYLIDESPIPSLFTTPSVAITLVVRNISVNAVDQSTGNIIQTKVSIESSATTTIPRNTVTSTAIAATPNVQAIINDGFITPVSILVPSENPMVDTIMVSIQDIISNGMFGLVGSQDSVNASLGADVNISFNYLPYVRIAVIMPDDTNVQITGDPNGRFQQTGENLFQILEGYNVSCIGIPLDPSMTVQGWTVNGAVTTQQNLILAVTEDTNIQLLANSSDETFDVSVFPDDTTDWSMVTSTLPVSETVNGNVLDINSPANNISFGIAKSYNVQAYPIVTGISVTLQYSIQGSNPSLIIYVCHGAGIQFDENGVPQNIHSQVTLGPSGTVTQNMPITGHPGGPITVYISAADPSELVQDDLLIQSIVVSYDNPPIPPPTQPVIIH